MQGNPPDRSPSRPCACPGAWRSRPEGRHNRTLELREALALEEASQWEMKSGLLLAGPVGVVVGGEIQLGGLRLHDHRITLSRGFETVGHAIVIDPSGRAQPPRKAISKLVAAVVQRAELGGDLGAVERSSMAPPFGPPRPAPRQGNTSPAIFIPIRLSSSSRSPARACAPQRSSG